MTLYSESHILNCRVKRYIFCCVLLYLRGKVIKHYQEKL